MPPTSMLGKIFAWVVLVWVLAFCVSTDSGVWVEVGLASNRCNVIHNLKIQPACRWCLSYVQKLPESTKHVQHTHTNTPNFTHGHTFCGARGVPILLVFNFGLVSGSLSPAFHVVRVKRFTYPMEPHSILFSRHCAQNSNSHVWKMSLISAHSIIMSTISCNKWVSSPTLMAIGTLQNYMSPFKDE